MDDHRQHAALFAAIGLCVLALLFVPPLCHLLRLIVLVAGCFFVAAWRTWRNDPRDL